MQNIYSPTARLHRAVASGALLLAGVAFAQSDPAGSSPEEVVALPQFTITERPANPYQSAQALSASRVAMPIQDIPQMISIVAGELLQDSMSQRMLDVAKYVTPVSESSLTMGSDRYQIRGYQVSHERRREERVRAAHQHVAYPAHPVAVPGDRVDHQADPDQPQRGEQPAQSAGLTAAGNFPPGRPCTRYASAAPVINVSIHVLRPKLIRSSVNVPTRHAR